MCIRDRVTFVPAVHWSKRTLTDTDRTLWGSFLIEYKNKKILFACDTGYGNIYKELGEKYGPIDLTFINIGAYNFYPMAPKKDKSIFHTNPEEALNIGLADKLTSKENLMQIAKDFAEEITSSAPMAVESIRSTLRGDLAEQVEEIVDWDLREQVRLQKTEDFKAGIAASLSREIPKFNRN